MSNERRDLFGTNIPTSILSRPSHGRRNDEPGIESRENLKLMMVAAGLSLTVVFSAMKVLESHAPEKQTQKTPVSENRGVAVTQPDQNTEHDLRP